MHGHLNVKYNDCLCFREAHRTKRYLRTHCPHHSPYFYMAHCTWLKNIIPAAPTLSPILPPSLYTSVVRTCSADCTWLKNIIPAAPTLSPILPPSLYTSVVPTCSADCTWLKNKFIMIWQSQLGLGDKIRLQCVNDKKFINFGSKSSEGCPGVSIIVITRALSPIYAWQWLISTKAPSNSMRDFFNPYPAKVENMVSS